MFEKLMQGGPFMIPIILLLLVIIVISIKNIKDPFFTNSIILLGIISALVGIVATYIGISNAFQFIKTANAVSPEILFNGFSMALITTYAGGIVLLFSVITWFYFIKKHNLYVV